ncbi:MAG: type II toxin-antitoxin system VapC family toxin [Euryarchaeota archaeon]|nr:type II toxin-antitoxin system VapC family toxin [Euryarchaeota archaeon]
MMIEIFLDASYAIALSTTTDRYHKLAEMLATKIEAEGTRLVTTRAAVLEIGNALAKLRYRSASVMLLKALEEDPSIEIIPLSEELYEKGRQLYRERVDKEWGLTDCISFIAMQEYGLTEALTTDRHFEQAGFKVLLREKS